ncbi:MAG: aconitase X catalytic domain-containing protein [Acidimicrobiia bacterium]|nr:aconitase X catalytic domain-containing protein [Acidimicrobiia bacterium]MDH5505415.1 aconitase X catalytic domain-containing protein [Acidimicrobiia bacterium]
MTVLRLSEADEAMLAGEAGPQVALGMRIVTGLAAASGARSLLDISRAHIDGCLYNGRASLDFAERLTGAQVAVPTTLNVSSLDLLHPDLIQSSPETQQRARALMDAYTSIGAQPTWTCAPYQSLVRPSFGEQIAWAESSAVVFANSVLGARTDRYGDFIDAAAAITGRAPAAGLHLDENRRAEVAFDVAALSPGLKQRDAFFAMLGLIVGTESGKRVPAVVGIDEATEDQLKTFGAAAASSGSVGMFHVVGVTPEAPTLRDVAPAELPTITVTGEMLRTARQQVNAGADSSQLGSVHLGTPHYSISQLDAVLATLARRAVKLDVYISTGRDVLVRWGKADLLTELGVTIVTDTCTYVTSIVDPRSGSAMTDSAKWAYYAPGNIGVKAIFGSMEECVETAVAGRLTERPDQWT